MCEFPASCFKQLTPPICSLKKPCFWINLIYLRSISFPICPSISVIPFYSSTGEVLKTLKICSTAADKGVYWQTCYEESCTGVLGYSSLLVPTYYSLRPVSSKDSVPCFLPLKLILHLASVGWIMISDRLLSSVHFIIRIILNMISLFLL
jgi:hypothetical protein